jgi:transcription elongation factor GreA
MTNLDGLEKRIPGQKFYLTKEGLEKIKRDFENLKEIRKSKVQGEAPKLLHSDDLDPEYLSLFDDLDLLETRIADLEHVVKNAEMIRPPTKSKKNTIQMGAKVLVDIDGAKDEFKIVGTLEANPSLGKISPDSPVGRALLGHKVGEEIIISSPIKTHYKIKKIKYT